MPLARFSSSAPADRPSDRRRRMLGVGAMVAIVLSGAPAARAMEKAPAGAVETGAPAFVVLGPEALGTSAVPTDIKLLPDGRVLVVAQRDIAFSDGTRWNTFRAALEGPSIVSTVAVDIDGEIYAGIEGGFAKVRLNEGQRWHLEPVMKLPASAAAQDSALISVTNLGRDWIWYGGNGAIVSWRPGREATNEGHTTGIDRIFTLGGSVYVSEEASGALFRLRGDSTMEPLNRSSMLVSTSITCATQFDPGRVLVGTGSNGLQLFDGEKFEPFGQRGLPGKGFRITDVCAAGEGYFAAAVDSVGIIFFDREGRLVQVLDRSLDHRLARARRLVYSGHGVLWALLNDGVARVQFPSPVSDFAPLVPSGMSYAEPMRHAGLLWLLADGRAMRGEYDDSGRLERFVDDTPEGDYLFTLNEWDGWLFGANEQGIHVRENSGWRLIVPGAVNARVGVGISRAGGIVYVARGEYGIIHESIEGYQTDRFPMPELGDSYGAQIDARGIGWLELGTSRLARVDFTGEAPEIRIFGPESGILNSGWVEIYVLDGVARFHVQATLYRFDERSGTIVEDRELLAHMPQLAIATGRPVTDPLGRLWYTFEGTMRVTDRTAPGGNKTVSIAPVNFSPTNYTMQDDGIVWMFARGRLARMDPHFPSPPDAPLHAKITTIHFSTSTRDEVNPGPTINPIEYSDNSLVFNFAAPANPFGQPVTFEVMLEGSSATWVSTGTVGSAVFNRLKEDRYVFRVRPVRAGAHGEEASVAFTVLPPWYRATAAWVAYTCIALSALGFVMWLASFLQRRENERLELLVAQRTSELSASNNQLGDQIEETTQKSVALSASEERYRALNAELENRVRQRTAELEDAHRQLVTASRKAGMAEVATGVLHNVGNVLNSVNVSATVVRDTLRTSEVASLERVAGMMRAHNGDIGEFIATDPKGRHLPRFIIQLSEQIVREHSVIRAENEHLVRNVEHIKGIVSMQQGYATASGVLEEVSLQSLVADAIGMHANSLSRHGIKIVHEFASLPPVLTDKHKVLQVLVNLVQNAKQAVRDSGREDGLIVARVAASTDGASVHVSIADNGVGIPAENLLRIFSHGFTTRDDGHGFGLHSGALAAREIGGSLKAESPGPGLGATFTLELPLNVAASPTAP